MTVRIVQRKICLQFTCIFCIFAVHGRHGTVENASRILEFLGFQDKVNRVRMPVGDFPTVFQC